MACEVVVFTQDPYASLGSLELDHLDLLFASGLIEPAYGRKSEFSMCYRSRIGAWRWGDLAPSSWSDLCISFVPPVPARMWGEQAYYRVNQRGLLQDLIQRGDDNQRILYQDEHAIAFVPICAIPTRSVAPIQPVATFIDLTSEQRWGLPEP